MSFFEKKPGLVFLAFFVFLSIFAAAWLVVAQEGLEDGSVLHVVAPLAEKTVQDQIVVVAKAPRTDDLSRVEATAQLLEAENASEDAPVLRESLLGPQEKFTTTLDTRGLSDGKYVLRIKSCVTQQCEEERIPVRVKNTPPPPPDPPRPIEKTEYAVTPSNLNGLFYLTIPDHDTPTMHSNLESFSLEKGTYSGKILFFDYWINGIDFDKIPLDADTLLTEVTKGVVKRPFTIGGRTYSPVRSAYIRIGYNEASGTLSLHAIEKKSSVFACEQFDNRTGSCGGKGWILIGGTNVSLRYSFTHPDIAFVVGKIAEEKDPAPVAEGGPEEYLLALLASDPYAGNLHVDRLEQVDGRFHLGIGMTEDPHSRETNEEELHGGIDFPIVSTVYSIKRLQSGHFEEPTAKEDASVFRTLFRGWQQDDAPGQLVERKGRRIASLPDGMNVSTDVVVVHTLEERSVILSIPTRKTVNAIITCTDWDPVAFACNGKWSPTRIPFRQNGNTLTFGTTGGQMIAYAGASINVINLQSYPTVGGTWRVRFTTIGTADLIIRPADGTTWSSTPGGADLTYLSVTCGTTLLTPAWRNGAAVFPNYHCDEEGNEQSLVNTHGKHVLQFQFGGSVAYAHNQTQTEVNTVTFLLGQRESTAELGDNTYFYFPDTNVYLPEDGIVVRSAWVEFSAVSDFNSTTGNNDVVGVDVNVNNTIYTPVTSQYTDEASENEPFRVLTNVTSSFASFSNPLLLRVGVKVNHTTTTGTTNLNNAVIHITYEYDPNSATRVRTVRFPIGSSQSERAAGGAQTFAFNAQIPGNPTVRSRWFELGAITRVTSTTDPTITAKISGSATSTGGTYDNVWTDSLYMHYLFSPNTGFNLNTADTLTVTVANQPALLVGGELWVTYEFPASDPIQTRTATFFVGADDRRDFTSKNDWIATMTVPENNVSISNLWARVYGGYYATTAGTHTIVGSVGGQAAASRAFSIRGAGEITSGYRIIYDMNTIASSLSGGSMVVDLNSTYSVTSTDPAWAVLFMTYTFDANSAQRLNSNGFFVGNTTGGTTNTTFSDTLTYLTQGALTNTLTSSYFWSAVSEITATETNIRTDINSVSAQDFNISNSGEPTFHFMVNGDADGVVNADNGSYSFHTAPVSSSSVGVSLYISYIISQSPPDVNVLYPQNGQSFNASMGGTIDVNLSIQDIDSNAEQVLVDLNYSSSPTQGTGTPILDDANLATFFTCASNDLSTARECTYAWDINGITPGNYYILASVTDFSSTDFDAGDGNFTITSGSSDYSFALILPSSGCTTGQGNLSGGSACERGYIVTSDVSYPADQNQVAPEGQIGATPFLVFDNQSSTLSDFNIIVDINQDIGPYFVLKAAQSRVNYQGDCDGNPITGCIKLTTAPVHAGTAHYSVGIYDLYLYLWGDFVSAPAISKTLTVDANSVDP